jgi:hypothetical protein
MQVRSPTSFCLSQGFLPFFLLLLARPLLRFAR